MSVEAPIMSAGPAMSPPIGPIGIPSLGGEFSVSTIGSLSSFGPEMSPVSINVGDANQPSLNSDIFSLPELTVPTASLGGTFEMPAPSPESLESGKIIQDVSAFKNTQILWQAPPAIKSDALLLPDLASQDQVWEAVDNPQIETDKAVILGSAATPESTLKTDSGQARTTRNAISVLDLNSQINNFMPEQEVEITTTIMPIEVTQQEIIADAQQALKVEETLVGIGTPKAEAHAIALEHLSHLTGGNSVTNAPKDKTKPIEHYFEHDFKADAEREKTIAAAFEQATEKATIDGKKEITGYDLAQEMPNNPQPTQIKSEIVKNGRDGSFDSLIKEIESIAKIKLGENVKSIILKIINNNHAVKLTDTLSAHEATREEVAKVVKSGVIFSNKI